MNGKPCTGMLATFLNSFQIRSLTDGAISQAQSQSDSKFNLYYFAPQNFYLLSYTSNINQLLTHLINNKYTRSYKWYEICY